MTLPLKSHELIAGAWLFTAISRHVLRKTLLVAFLGSASRKTYRLGRLKSARILARQWQVLQDACVLDEYKREALGVSAGPRMGNTEVLEVLYPLFLKYGKPEFVRSDNGTEIIAGAFQNCHQSMAETVQSSPPRSGPRYAPTGTRNSNRKWYISRGLDKGGSTGMTRSIMFE